jgi:CRISPR/Cas system-associated endonuclease Cas1
METPPCVALIDSPRPRFVVRREPKAPSLASPIPLGNCTRALVGLGLDPSFGFLHHADAPGRLSLSYDAIELLRPRVDACVFRFLKSRPFDRKEFDESGSQVLLGQRTAREVALRVLAEVPANKCEEAARRLADCILRGSKNMECLGPKGGSRTSSRERQ